MKGWCAVNIEERAGADRPSVPCGGTVQDLIAKKLDEIEKKEHVRILHAVESGSRAWGFASPDSDYDVRFIYLRPSEDYLRLEQTKDFIDWELNETLDINGWDLTKALQHFHKSNTTLFEWSGSPIVYRSTPEWAEVKKTAARWFSVRSGMYQYYGTAKSNFQEHLQGEQVRYKKYFYVLRPLLACKWIAETGTPPPVPFGELSRKMLPDYLKPAVEQLLALKKAAPESGTGPKVPELNEWIAESLLRYKEIIESMKDDRNPDWDELNRLFRNLVFGGSDRN